MSGLKEYAKPKMILERFTPQEYIAGCWKCTLWCEGTPFDRHNHAQIYVFDAPYTGGTYRPEQMVEHSAHMIGVFKVISDTEPDATYFETEIGEFSAIIASQSAVAPGHQTFVGGKEDEYTAGYCWPSIGEYSSYNYCFARDPEWVLVEDNPNAS